MSEFNFLNFECPACFNENAYFNGLVNECPDCDSTWSNERSSNKGNKFYDEYEEDDEDEFKKQSVRTEEVRRAGNKIDRNALKNLFSPDWQYNRALVLYSEENDDVDEYQYAITYSLLEFKKFSEIQTIQPPKNLSEAKVNQLIEKEVKAYLESRDELPLVPSVEDWANYIGAPKSLIEKIIPKPPININQLIDFLPKVDQGDLTPLFRNRISQFHLSLKKKGVSEAKRITVEELEDMFAALADNEHINYGYDYPFDFEMGSYLSKEFNVISKYKKDLNKWDEGSFDKLILDAQEQKLSMGETVVFILENYFKEIME